MKWISTIAGVCLVGIWPATTLSMPNSEYWRVEPDTCLVSEDEKACVMRIKVTLLEPASDTLCVHFKQQDLTCFAKNDRVKWVEITLKQDSWLTLHGDEGIKIAQHALIFTSLSEANFRQRTRLPWSFF